MSHSPAYATVSRTPAFIVAMIAWKFTQPIREKKARRAELLLTSDAANLDRVVRVWGDDWLGYLIFRSRRFQKEMQQYRLGVRYDLVFDFKERFRGLEKGDCDFVAATIDSYLANGQESGFPGVAGPGGAGPGAPQELAAGHPAFEGRAYGPPRDAVVGPPRALRVELGPHRHR